jgi:GATA zinc finger
MRRGPGGAHTLCNACGIMFAAKGVLRAAPPLGSHVRGQVRPVQTAAAVRHGGGFLFALAPQMHAAASMCASETHVHILLSGERDTNAVLASVLLFIVALALLMCTADLAEPMQGPAPCVGRRCLQVAAKPLAGLLRWGSSGGES